MNQNTNYAYMWGAGDCCVVFFFSLYFVHVFSYQKGFPASTSGEEPVCQCRRCKIHGFDPWVRKISWRRT